MRRVARIVCWMLLCPVLGAQEEAEKAVERAELRLAQARVREKLAEARLGAITKQHPNHAGMEEELRRCRAGLFAAWEELARAQVQVGDLAGALRTLDELLAADGLRYAARILRAKCRRTAGEGRERVFEDWLAVVGAAALEQRAPGDAELLEAVRELRALPDRALPALAGLVRASADEKRPSELRCEAVTTLGMLGPAAASAAPVLEELKVHADRQLAARATAALRQVTK